MLISFVDISNRRDLILQYLQESYLRWSTKNVPLFGLQDFKLYEESLTTSSQFKHYLQKPLPEDEVITLTPSSNSFLVQTGGRGVED